ncbi:hypothetical protein BKP35_01140 [Anaerobacillus arseniciselenatis]|uniref:UPF0316 protein BKP35_01140 n=1 Tax=Anaerobacillus arseniciselenatis TaxID=85682 RepID=A0A1S2LSY2_9BACI|nr:DUF2179 domain-containing protein [Anaerobacillus arseniciselenatis]OIJ15628.1 hypothetical protein BKP35_01140 [Anaerobacillus arseniciselenatis]
MLQPMMIFFAQLLLVPILTMRTILVVKGMKKQACGIGMLEGFIYVFAIGLVFSDLSNYMNIIAYAAGFGTGVYLGGTLEEKLAIGYVTVEANVERYNDDLLNKLRDVGFSVSTNEVKGMNSVRYLLYCTARRDRENEFYKIIYKYEPTAFVVSYEPRKFEGGYITKSLKNRRELFLEKTKETFQFKP